MGLAQCVLALAARDTGNAPHRVATDARPLRFYVQSMAEHVKRTGRLGLKDLVLSIDAQPTRESLVGSFCALLELCKIGLVKVKQPEGGGEIELEYSSEAGDLDTVLAASVFDDEQTATEEQTASAAPAEPVQPEADQSAGEPA